MLRKVWVEMDMVVVASKKENEYEYESICTTSRCW